MKFFPQHDLMDCGPACLAMISNYLGKKYSIEYIRKNSFISKEGVSLLNISEAAKKIGLDPFASMIDIETLNEHGTLPCIIHWNKKHFVVLYDVKESFFFKKRSYKIADPTHGLITLDEEEVKKSWVSDDGKGIALFLIPTENFYQQSPPDEKKFIFKFLLGHLKPFKAKIALLFLLLFLGSGLTLIFPFLTQALIDKGVNAKNLNYITIILLSQLAVFVGSIVIEIFRNSMMLFVGSKMGIAIISDFLKKLLQLPISYFDSKMTGDFTQRIQDNERIEEFLTSQSLLTFFSVITFSVFFGVLWSYDFKILLVYAIMTTLSVLWSNFFMKKRRYLDYFRFQERSRNQDSILEIFNGIPEMKLNNFEEFKRKEWKKIQDKLFNINIRILKNDQFQMSGFEFINQLKNILVTFLAATYVVKGDMSLGALLSVSYIIGQMNSPVNQLIVFFRSLLDAQTSLERLNEVQNHDPEECENLNKFDFKKDSSIGLENKGIRLNNISFQYEGPNSPYILEDIDLFIPDGKITAIVGSSGSGKTTLMKLLLKFYPASKGNIFYDLIDSVEISPKSLRENCGVVMQDGYIFSDTIERNIATSDEKINYEKLWRASKIANIDDFIDKLPLKYNTKIGASGNGISGGQKQRMLIARAVYKNPKYIFFDEATSALDAENEKIIHDNLQEFFKGKTVVIIAHRLSTVKNADQIIVLKEGQVVEQGNHQQLVDKKGDYFNLVKNQLELGN
ncbi:Toxin RTX-I translocation ATP-binding protein [Flavobacterium columnare]|uniref:Peptidase domain-containing ABC transporter n=2 Tax=Flavobacterium TaxID=237 RepID=A0ABW8PKQ8_9FLAO|nr:peptidase domain-containing ABC transporter [Flavobacterium columnare]SPE77541.1 Toxin RTX-I translocation ATP-binding protein [Flavobacterium columnare]